MICIVAWRAKLNYSKYLNVQLYLTQIYRIFTVFAVNFHILIYIQYPLHISDFIASMKPCFVMYKSSLTSLKYDLKQSIIFSHQATEYTFALYLFLDLIFNSK